MYWARAVSGVIFSPVFSPKNGYSKQEDCVTEMPFCYGFCGFVLDANGGDGIRGNRVKEKKRMQVDFRSEQ